MTSSTHVNIVEFVWRLNGRSKTYGDATGALIATEPYVMLVIIIRAVEVHMTKHRVTLPQTELNMRRSSVVLHEIYSLSVR